jgi:hypothetical protein
MSRVAAAVALVVAMGVTTGVAVASRGAGEERAIVAQDGVPPATPKPQPTPKPWTPPKPPRAAAGEKLDVISDSAIDDGYRPDVTAGDWLTYADHVVVATVLAEKDLRPVRETRGEGWYDRRVTLRVDELLWSNRQAEHPAPKTFAYKTWGYRFTKGDPANRVRVAVEDRPRVELGHRYIFALAWEASRCSPGDAPQPGQWRHLAQDSILPYDGEIIGTGEMEGSHQDASKARAALLPDDPNFSLEDAMLGCTTDDLLDALAKATPAPAARYSVGTPCT